MALWFRFYSEALDDPKVQSLPPDAFKAWVNLLCIASKTSGALPSIDQIAFHLRCDNETANTFHEELAKRGLIDVGARGSRIHSWDKRQYKSDTSTERVKRFRKREESVSVTPPEPETEPDTEVKRDTNVSPKKPTPFDELLSVIDKERARDVIDHRNKIKKPMTSKAAKMLAAKLAEFDDPNKAADFMIEKGWVSIEKDWVRNAMTNGVRGSPPPQQLNGKPRNIAEASTQLLAQMRAENANTQPGTSHSLLEPNVPRLAAPIRQFGPE